MLTAAASNRRSIEFCTRPSQLLGWLRTKSWPSHHRVLQGSLLGNSAARSYVLFAKKTGSGTDWGRRLQEDKDELSKIWKTTRSWASNVRREAIEEAPTNDTKQKKLRYRTDFEAHRSALQTASVRWRFAREELAMVMACARASSAPNSSERNAQANRLVSLSLAPLQKSISEMGPLEVGKDGSYRKAVLFCYERR